MPAPNAPVITGTTSNGLASAFKWEQAATGDRATHYRVEYRCLTSRATFDAVGEGTMPVPADNAEGWTTWQGSDWPLQLPYLTIAYRALGNVSYEGQPPTPGIRVRIRSENADGNSSWSYVPTNAPTVDVENARRGMVGFDISPEGRTKPVVSIDITTLNGRGFSGYCFGGGGTSGREVYVMSLFAGADTPIGTPGRPGGTILREAIIIPNQTFRMPYAEENTPVNFALRVVGIDTIRRITEVVGSGEFGDNGGYSITINYYVLDPPVPVGDQPMPAVVAQTTQVKFQIYGNDENGRQRVLAEENIDTSALATEADRAEAARQAATLTDLLARAEAEDANVRVALADFSAARAVVYGAGVIVTAGLIAFASAAVAGVGGTLAGLGAVGSAFTIQGGEPDEEQTEIREAIRSRIRELESGYEDVFAEDVRSIVVQAERGGTAGGNRIADLLSGLRITHQANEQYIDRVNEYGQRQGYTAETHTYEEVEAEFRQRTAEQEAAAEEFRNTINQIEVLVARGRAARLAARRRTQATLERLQAGQADPFRAQTRRGDDPRTSSTAYTSGEFEDYVALVNARIMSYARPSTEPDLEDEGDLQARFDAAQQGISLATQVGDVVERYLDFGVNLITGIRSVTERPVIIRIAVGRTDATPVWTAVEEVTSYTLEVYPAAGDLTESNRLQQVTGITTTMQRVTGLVTQTEYRFRVRGVGSSGRAGPWSDVRTASTVTPLPEVIQVRARNIESTSAVYFFNTVGDAVTYEVERAAADGSVQSFRLTHPANTVSDTLLSGSTQYFLRGRATGLGGTGPWGPTFTFTTPVEVPDAAPTFNISGIQATQVRIQWQLPERATGVRIEWSTDSTFPSASTTAAISPPGTERDITGLVRDTTYYVRMRGLNASGNGPWSPTQTFTTTIITGAPVLTFRAPVNGGIDPNNAFRRVIRYDTSRPELPGEPLRRDVQTFVEVSLTSSPFTPITRLSLNYSAVSTAVNPTAADLAPDTTYWFRARWRQAGVNGPWSQPVSLRTEDLFDQPEQPFLSQLQRPPGFAVAAPEVRFLLPPEFQKFVNVVGTTVLNWRIQISYEGAFASPFVDQTTSLADRTADPYEAGDRLAFSAPISSMLGTDFIPDTDYFMRFGFLREVASAKPAADHVTGHWSDIISFRSLPPELLGPPRVLFQNFTSAQVEFDAATFPAGNITYTVRWGQDGTETGRSPELTTAGEYRIAELDVASSYWTDYRINYTDGNGNRNNTPWSPRANIITPLPAPPASAPEPLNIENVGFTQATARWSTVPSISDYQIQVNERASLVEVLNERVTGTTYDITGLEEGGRYRVRVRAFRYGVSGPWTPYNSFETLRGFSERTNVLPPVPPGIRGRSSVSRQVAILASINFGEVFGGGRPIIRYYSLAGHDVNFEGRTYRKTDELMSVSGVGTRLGLGQHKIQMTFANKGADIIAFVQEPYAYRTAPTDIIYCLMGEGGEVLRSRTFRFYNYGHKINENTMTLEAVNFWQHLDTLNGIRTSYNDQKIAIELGLYSDVDPETREQRGTGFGEEDLAFLSSTIDFSAIQSGRIRKDDGTLTGGASAPDRGEDYTRQVPYGENWLRGNIVQAWNPSPTRVAGLGYTWAPGPERSDLATQWTTVVYAVAEGELADLQLALFDMKDGDIDTTFGGSFTLQTSGEDGYYLIPLQKQTRDIRSARIGETQIPRAVAFVQRSLGTNRGAEFPETASLSSQNAEWTEQHRGAGTALVAITFKAWANQGWPGGWPKIAFKTSGKLIRTLDGSNALSPSTNPADVIYDYLTDRRYGCSVPPGYINLQGFQAARGSYTRQAGDEFYTAFLRGVVDSKKTIGQNLNEMLDACQSELYLDRAGLLTLLPKTTLSRRERARAFGEFQFDADRRGGLQETVSSPPSSRHNRARVTARIVNRGLEDTHDYEAVSRSALEEDFFIRNEVQINNPFLSIRRTRRNEVDPNDRNHLRAMAIHSIVSSRKFRKGRFTVPDGLWRLENELQVGSIITVASGRRGWAGDRVLLARVVQLDVKDGGNLLVHYQEYSDDIYDVGGSLIQPVSPVFRGPSFGGLQAEPGESLDRLPDVPVRTYVLMADDLFQAPRALGFRYRLIGTDPLEFELGEYDFGMEEASYAMTVSPSYNIGRAWGQLQFAPLVSQRDQNSPADFPDTLVNVLPDNGYAFANAMPARFDIGRNKGVQRIGVRMRLASMVGSGYEANEGMTFTIARHRQVLG